MIQKLQKIALSHYNCTWDFEPVRYLKFPRAGREKGRDIDGSVSSIRVFGFSLRTRGPYVSVVPHEMCPSLTFASTTPTGVWDFVCSQRNKDNSIVSSYISLCFLKVVILSTIIPKILLIFYLIESRHGGFVLYSFLLPAASENSTRCQIGYSTWWTLLIELEAVLCRTDTVSASIILPVKWKGPNPTEVLEGASWNHPSQRDVRGFMALMI